MNLLMSSAFLPIDKIAIQTAPRPSHHLIFPLTTNSANTKRKSKDAPRYIGPTVKGRFPQ